MDPDGADAIAFCHGSQLWDIQVQRTDGKRVVLGIRSVGVATRTLDALPDTVSSLTIIAPCKAVVPTEQLASICMQGSSEADKVAQMLILEHDLHARGWCPTTALQPVQQRAFSSCVPCSMWAL